MKNSRGFTLIELVVVITILGILAAVALPKFVNLQRDARIAKLNAARGSVSAAVAMVYGAAQARSGQVQPACPATGTVPTTINAAGNGSICGQQSLVTVTNWNPQASLTGIVTAAGLSSITPASTQSLAADGYAVANAGTAIGSTISIRVLGGTDVPNCSFTYTPSTNGAAGTSATVGAVVTTGC